MRRALITLSSGDEYKKIAELTHSSMKDYAGRIKADFIDLGNEIENSKEPHWLKFEIYKYFQKYDRILWLDTDLLVRDDCPDMFEFVPKNKIGIFEEGKYAPRGEYMKRGMDVYGISFKWDGKYFNTGVMVLSKCHARLFIPPSKKLKDSKTFISGGMLYTFLGEQTYLNIQLLSDEVFKENIFELNYRYNRMTLMDSLTGEPRHASFIIHYAGCPSKELMIETIEKDKKEWEEASSDYSYKKNIVFSVSGGLGDQVCAEPVIRYCRNKFYPEDNVVILTHFPTLFKHLNLPTYKPDHEFDLSKGPYSVLDVYPGTDKPIWRVLSNSLVNATDFESISVCGRILPDEDKRIYLRPNSNSRNEITNIISLDEARNLVLVHPGNGYKAKSFPVEWWNKVIKGLIEKNIKVGLIGKTISEKQGYLNVDCIDGVIDFRDFLSLDGLMFLISLAQVLVSNDSAPVHIAGAFDNWIVLIATMKHPDHVLPYRCKSKYFKAKSLYKRLTIDDESINSSGVSLALTKDSIEEYLPDAQKVIGTIESIYKEGEKC